MSRRFPAAIAALALVAPGAFAQSPKPLDRAELDARVKQIVFDNTATGVELFNAGNAEACLGVYRGTLMALAPLLDHRPALADKVKAKLVAAKGMKAADAAFALREVLDDVGRSVGTAGKPLWDRLGGEAAVRGVVGEFLTTAAKDPKANIDRGGNYPLTKERSERVVQLVVEFVSQATGGPLKYSGRDMKNSHQGMKITEDEFNAAAGHLIAALKKYNVPKDVADEFVALVATTAKDMVEVKK